MDLLTSDVAAARRFYGDLLGWTFDDHGDLAVARLDGRPVAALVPLRVEEAPHWLPSLSVPDPDAAAARVRRAGGAVHLGPKAMPGRGRVAVVRDAQGAALVLLRSATGDPVGGTPPVGGFGRTALVTPDPDGSFSLYRDLVGYEASPVDEAETPPESWVLSKDGARCAAAFRMRRTDLPAQWIPGMRVKDAAETARRAEELGGRIVVGTDDPRAGGRLALLEDPTGAVFFVQGGSR
jgi:predicted enzyme related to lactoylglutathione lyase